MAIQAVPSTRQLVQDVYFQALNEQKCFRDREKTQNTIGQLAALKVVIALLDLLRVTACTDVQMTKAVNALDKLTFHQIS